MKNIQRNETKLQIFLESLIYIWQLFFDCLPEQPVYVCPVKKLDEERRRDRAALKLAVAAFEARKRGAAAAGGVR